MIREIAQAHDVSQICLNCGSFIEVTSRSSVRKTHCRLCKEKIAAEERAVIVLAQEDLTAQIQLRINQTGAMSILYDALPGDIVLLLLALNRAIAPRLLHGTFMRDDCRALAPANVSDFIAKLCRACVIVDQPEMANATAYFLENGSLRHYLNMVVYRLTPDKNLGGGEAGMAYLEQMELRDNQAIRNLWLDFATADCMRYLFTRCELHGFVTDQKDNHEMYSTLHAALRQHSVSQLWSVIWKIVEDVAALSTRVYYSKSKAVATLPGKLQRYLEKIERAQTNFGQTQWGRPTSQPAGTLGQLFSERYNIDESTLGSEVMNLFVDPIADTDADSIDPPFEEIEESALQLMGAAIGHYSASHVLLCFADAIRAGANVKSAIDEVFETYSFLSDPY